VTSQTKGRGAGGYAFLVAAGILLSRIAGLVRERVFSHYFGLTDTGDAYKAAFKIPNILQNLFGEGVLSASFIPVYARLLAEGDEREANRVAGAIFSFLALAVSLLVLIGVLATPWMVDAIAPGFSGDKRELLVRLVRIVFPGAGLLALSAWCLGVLNSHRRFFLSYAAPLVWNAVIIAVLLGFGNRRLDSLAEVAAWGAVAGSALQFLVQLPVVLRLAPGIRLGLARGSRHVRQVVRNFGPVCLSRGVVQVSAYVDNLLASYLGAGAVTALYNAQTIYLLPVSLFGMAVSAAELPLMSSTTGSAPEVAGLIRDRLERGLRRISFFVVPSAMAFFALGDLVTGVIYQSGRFSRTDSLFVWSILAGAGLGLLATTSARLYSSTFWALGDTRTPFRFAMVRVLLGAVLGYLAAFQMPGWVDLDRRWGVAGLTVAASLAGWIEYLLLRRAMNRRIGSTGHSIRLVTLLWCAAGGAAAAALGGKRILGTGRPLLAGLGVLALYAGGYLMFTLLLRVPEATALVDRVRSRASSRGRA
jgi:putative peptidoglycan lipid II flippase